MHMHFGLDLGDPSLWESRSWHYFLARLTALLDIRDSLTRRELDRGI